MPSSFSVIGMLLENARKAEARQPAPRHVTPSPPRDREAERRELLADMKWGAEQARKFAAQQAVEADPEAQREAFHKAQALKIVNAGRAARGLPLLKRLMQDESPEYPDGDNYNSPGDPDDGGDDAPNPKDKSKKKTVKKKVEEEDEEENQNSGADDQPSSEEDQEEAKKRRDKAAALSIVNAGRRRRNLPLLSKLEQDR
jgi:uncharacterized protein YkwD